MVNEATLVTQAQAAALLGVTPNTVSDLVKAWGLVKKPMSNGSAHGLDRKDMRVLSKALNGGKARVGAA